jgi:selenide,water dikinase
VTRDDAAVYRLSAERCLIATVDFFTPIVDDAATWGAIAAANALSDVYAMGGRPLFALNLVGWPRETLPFSLLGEALAGAGRVMAQAQCPMVGGHSIDDPEPKLGMAVIGEAHPDRLLTNSAGRPGDVLVLTKPLGTGILTTAAKRQLLTDEDLAPAVSSMTTLNDGAMRAALAADVRCATDVTGFGLLGHLRHIVTASGVGAEVSFGALPLLPRVMEFIGRGVVPGGTRRNLEAAHAEWAAEIAADEQLLACDAQTSGGLLLAVAAERLETLLHALRSEGTPAAAVIGRLTGDAGTLRVTR